MPVHYWSEKRTSYEYLYKQMVILSKLNTMATFIVIDNIFDKMFAQLYVDGKVSFNV